MLWQLVEGMRLDILSICIRAVWSFGSENAAVSCRSHDLELRFRFRDLAFLTGLFEESSIVIVAGGLPAKLILLVAL